MLLEQVRHELEIVAEGHVALDQKIDRVAMELSKRMDVGFGDIQTALRTIAKQLQEHETAHLK